MQYMPPPTDLTGLGYIGEMRMGEDGQVYQLQQTVDGLGNVGFAWLPMLANLLPTIGRIAQQIAPMVQQAAPILSQGLNEYAIDEPQLGEMRMGEDGQVYQLQQTVDGLGNVGFAWLPLVAQALPAIASVVGGLFGRRRRRRRVPAVAEGFGQMYDPSLAPGIGWAVSAPPDMMVDELGIMDDELGIMDDELGIMDDELGLADFYLGEESMYDMQGLEEDLPDDLGGFGLDPDDALGLDPDDAFGLAEEDLIGNFDGYLREPSGGQIQGYVPGPPSAAPAFVPGANSSPLWSPLW